MTTDYRVFTSGLRFPEGPLPLPDGSVLIAEMEARRLSSLTPDGAIRPVTELGGGPNGLAMGPDGKCYVCNNGGVAWQHLAGGDLQPAGMPEDYSGGRIEQVDLDSGRSRVMCDRSDAAPLRGPNDLVFDRHGGFWFTDTGKRRRRELEWGGVHYCRPGSGSSHEVIFPMLTPNGIGLSPNEDRLYVAETITGRIWAFDIEAPGQIARRPWPSPNGGELLTTLGGNLQLDSLAIDSMGNICVAALIVGGIFVISSEGRVLRHIPLPDPSTSNIAFGGAELRQAYVTLSRTGVLAVLDWPCAGLPLNFVGR